MTADAKFNLDDCILQAMVMLLLERIGEGFGMERTCRELPIWSNAKKLSELELESMEEGYRGLDCGRQAWQVDSRTLRQLLQFLPFLPLPVTRPGLTNNDGDKFLIPI
jgi:hypothetical protein